MFKRKSFNLRYAQAVDQQEKWTEKCNYAYPIANGGEALIVVSPFVDHTLEFSRREQQRMLAKVGQGAFARLSKLHNFNAELVTGDKAPNRLYKALGDRSIRHITVVSLGNYIDYSGEPRSAVELAERANHLKQGFEHLSYGNYMTPEELQVPLGDLLVVDPLRQAVSVKNLNIRSIPQ